VIAVRIVARLQLHLPYILAELREPLLKLLIGGPVIGVLLGRASQLGLPLLFHFATLIDSLVGGCHRLEKSLTIFGVLAATASIGILYYPFKHLLRLNTLLEGNKLVEKPLPLAHEFALFLLGL
jgi:hypothetical protein